MSFRENNRVISVWIRCLILLWAMLFLPSTIVLATAPVQLGPITFSRFQDHPLPLRDGLPPGGIEFESVAEPQPGLQIEKVWYDSKREDGQRLIVRVTFPGRPVQTVSARLFDWQMVPIAHIAIDNIDTLVTLFGSLEDLSETIRIRRQGHLIANVHPVLHNTLLGLRLIHADMLLLSKQRGSGSASRLPIQDIVCDLPAQNGAYLLGEGETIPSLGENKQAYSHIDGFRDKVFQRIGLGRSYVIQDDLSGIGISISGDRLRLSGDPLWTYWRYRADGEEYLRKVSQDLPSQVIQRLQQEQPLPENRRNRAVELYNELWNQALTDENGQEILVMPVEDSRSLSGVINQAQGANPNVYNALVNTMRYLAFFRYLSQQSPNQYEEFVNSLPSLGAFKNYSTPAIIPIGNLHLGSPAQR